ncbi:MAG TPA: porin family protein [Puia sp.]|nr:porin family protein [Puia sp.]
MILISFSTRAQITIGIKGGPDFARLNNAVQGDNGGGSISQLSSGTLTQFYGSVFADISLDSGRPFYIRPAVGYIGAGGSMNPTPVYYNSNGFHPSTKYALQYIEVPVEFVYSPRFDWGRPVVGAGFYSGVLVSGTIKSQGSPSRPVLIGDKSNDDFQRLDFGYTFTLGLITKPGFLFGIDYQHGFSRIVPDVSEQGVQPRLPTHNSVWAVHLGWAFKL